ncbi:hypothetical protein [Xenorhabdus eapokensis]|uniref:Transposase n=1 Tax=Xenorhabdus eapokensis TaxID=1873482 RepID=A0A1Q5TTP7_9GAMM|nr:hypothetical protein [Xenorhabdus eapokensis]OKP03601.1 transposase [Xenorhabdus eapokensis]
MKDAAAIAEARFVATTEHTRSYDCLLALEDTTSLEFTHRAVREEMGYPIINPLMMGYLLSKSLEL